MTQIPAPIKSTWQRTIAREHPSLALALSVMRRRLLLVGSAVSASWGLVTLLAIVVAGAWFDLMLDLSGTARAAIDVVCVFAGLCVCTRLFLKTRRTVSTMRLAHTIDRAVGAQGQITAGLDLVISPSQSDSSLTSGLAKLATRRAAELVGDVAVTDLAPTSPIARPTFALFGILIFIAVVGLFVPRLIGCQWLRFTEPFADHPPYSALQFLVQPGNTKVIYGQAVDINAKTWGVTADQVEIVLVPDGKPQQSIPMFRESDGQWRATLADMEIPGQYFLRSGHARTSRFDLGIITVPQIQKVAFTVTLPAYTNRPPYTGPLPQNGLSGLAGTTVVVRAQSNRPLSGGHLAVTQNGTVVQSGMIPQGNEAEATFQITGNGKFDLKLTDTDNQDSTETFTGNITLLKDQKPFVRIIEPMETSYATPDANVKITALAEDDYGVSKLEIFRGLNDSRYRSTDIPVPTPAPTQFPGVTNLKLDDYDLQPGDVVKLFAHVLDNDPAGAKGAQSTVVTINVVSQKDMDRMMMTRDAMETLQSKYSQAARKLEAIRAEADRLTKELAAADPNKPLTEAQQKELAKLAKELDAAAKDIDKLADHDLPIDLDKALKDQLKQMAAALKDAGQLADEASKPGMSVAGALDKLKAVNGKCNGEQKDFDENAQAPLEYFSKIFPLLQDQERFLEIYQQQKDLAERMQAMADKKAGDDPSVKAMMRDMRDEQQALRDQLQHLLDDIDDHVAQLPDDKRLDDLRDTARKFTAAVRSSPADTQMQASENSLDQFNGSDAVASARDAEETLDKFISRCQGMGDKASACLKFQPKLAAGLGNSISQMLSLSMGGAGIGGQGYSANANSLMKVGLYGTIPLMGKESRGGGKQADHGVGSAANGSPNGQTSPDAAGTNGQLNANGAGDAPIPPEYKQRVGDYFQRVEDELSQ